MKTAIQILCLVVVVTAGAVLRADEITDTMSAQLSWPEEGGTFSGSGSGYGNQWYFYPSEEVMDGYPDPGASLDVNYHWRRHWFRNDPLGPSASQLIDVTGSVSVLDPYLLGLPATGGYQPLGWVRLVINYTTEDWPGGDIPPMPGVMENYIVRELIFQGPLMVYWEETEPEPTDGDGPPSPGGIIYPIVIPQDIALDREIDYQPKWLAIGIQGHNIKFTGEATHEAVPEPATLILAAGGLPVLLRLRRHRN